VLDASLLYTLGQAYMQLQQFHEALEPFARLQQHFPGSPLVTAMAPRFAFALEQENRRAEALAVWQAYFQHGTIADETERQRLQLHVGRLALQQGQWDVALAFLAPARSAPMPAMAAESLFWSGEVYLQQQQWELAQQIYQELLDRYRAESHWTALAHLRLGTLYEKQQEWEQALQAYQASLATTTDAEVAASARRRIAAIAAGRVTPHKAPAAPSGSEG
jgi:tetratricopeptide (TPR) repeat protein